MKTVFTVGVFDMLHVGHVQLLRNARKLGDRLVVAVQDTDYVLRYKPDCKPVFSTEERMFMVKALKYVSEVVPYGAVDDIICQVPFDVFVVGPDQTHEGFRRAVRWCEDHGKELVVLPRTEGISSSWIKEQIKSM